MSRTLGLIAMTVVAGMNATAQDTLPATVPDGRVNTMVFTRSAQSGPHVEFLSNEFGLSGKVVKNAPYGAEAVTEQTQTLADGNRIVRKSSTAVYRDRDGRTRREVTMGSVGPWASQGEAPQFVFIHDPVLNLSYTLDPQARIARKLPGRSFMAETIRAKVGGKTAEAPPPPPPMHWEAQTADVVIEDGAVGAVAATPMVAAMRVQKADNAKKESLGKKEVEGVLCEGSRTTITIPAGEIGNERQINIVSEQWYSPDLLTIVLSRHDDPRLGETVYRLTRVRRDEPNPALFEPPADYKIEARELPEMRKLRIER